MMMIDRPLSRLPFERFRNPPPLVPVIRLAGVIGQVRPLRRGLTLPALAETIEHAFANPKAKAVALAINSPGGSPVQSSLIARRIRELADEKKKPVYAFVEDVAASGGYWLACAADEIYADATSIVGSIGVISAGFGLQDFIARHGIERRVYTAGTQKLILDPFQPEKPDDVLRLKQIQTEMHDSFKALVRERRGSRLKAPEDELFDGAFWTGLRGVELGLVDGLGHLRSVLRAKFGDKVKLREVVPERGWLRRRFGFVRPRPALAHSAGPPGGLPAGLGAALVEEALAALEERALWRRFGL